MHVSVCVFKTNPLNSASQSVVHAPAAPAAFGQPLVLESEPVCSRDAGGDDHAYYNLRSTDLKHLYICNYEGLKTRTISFRPFHLLDTVPGTQQVTEIASALLYNELVTLSETTE